MFYVIEFKFEVVYLTSIHYISFTSQQLCTLLATQRFIVH